ncbi:MAG: AraC family transcriptional regulator [Arcobacter sp.]|uniref:AraC family transcriptional regulator n=1 Tax=Arcobacter sp. TaxID=1872629 RepID=UPI003C74D88E
MTNDSMQLTNLCKLYGLENKNGFANTYIEEIKLFKVSSNEELMPLLYKKGFSFVGSGKKIGYINNVKFEHGYLDYLVISSPQPVECETYIMGDEPLVGIYITLDMNRLQKVVKKFTQFDSSDKIDKEVGFSITCNNRTDVIQNIYGKFLAILEDEIESDILANGLLDELYYRILQSNSGSMLIQLCQKDSNLSKISRVIDYIVENIEQKIDLDEMAKLADMSVNNFHKLFKQAMNDTPIQYIKKIRLEKAKQLIAYNNNMKVIEASNAVGYDNVSQFSREFKRYFGHPPSTIKKV